MLFLRGHPCRYWKGLSVLTFDDMSLFTNLSFVLHTAKIMRHAVRIKLTTNVSLSYLRRTNEGDLKTMFFTISLFDNTFFLSQLQIDIIYLRYVFASLGWLVGLLTDFITCQLLLSYFSPGHFFFLFSFLNYMVSSSSRVKMKERERKHKYLDLTKELKKLCKH